MFIIQRFLSPKSWLSTLFESFGAARRNKTGLQETCYTGLVEYNYGDILVLVPRDIRRVG